MANARGKEIDNTHLSIDQAEARGRVKDSVQSL